MKIKGWFSDQKVNIETILKERGEQLVKGKAEVKLKLGNVNSNAQQDSQNITTDSNAKTEQLVDVNFENMLKDSVLEAESLERLKELILEGNRKDK